MGKKVRSARGATVDFDLLKIKQQIATQPAPLNVKEREKFIDRRARRRANRNRVDPTKLDVRVEPKAFDIELESDMVESDTQVQDEVQVQDEAENVVVDTPTPPKPRKVRRKQ